MSKFNLIIISLILFSFGSFSQKRELGKVTIEELKQKSCPIDTSAAAAFLFKTGESKFEYSDRGFSIVNTVRCKIKIYKKEGYELANQIVSYYVSGSSDKLSFNNAVTYNEVGGKIEKTKLKNDGEFDEKVNRYWSQKKIVLPNVKEGSIIEFEYTLISDRFGSVKDWYFQTHVPVLFSEYKTYIPEYFKYNVLFRGFITPKFVTELKDRTYNFTAKDREDLISVKTTLSSAEVKYRETYTVYTLENIPAMKDETFVNNIKNYTSGVIHELSSIQYPNQPFKNFATDWETVVKKIYEDEDFGNELNKTGYFEKDVDALLAGTISQEEKIAVVFNYVKSRMNWNDYYGYSCNDGVKKAYQDKTGNIAEINLMLISMLRYAGFQVNPVLLSTRANGISLFPSRTAFNYVIAGLELNDQIVLLDATDKYSLPNILPIRDLNWFGRIIRKDKSSSEIDLMPKSNSREVVNVMAIINAQGEVSGKVRDQYFDYKALLFRNDNNSLSKESSVEKLEKKYQGIEIGDYETVNNNDLGKPIIENFGFKSTNAVEIIGDKMYVSPFLFFAKTENPFKQETREYPIDLIYPSQDKFNITLTIPEGYIVEVLPMAKAVTMPDDLANFKYSITNNGNQIQLMYSFDTNHAIIGSEYYEELKAFYKEIVNKQTEKIVLKKA
jgi:hypothetical protein